MNKSLFKLKRTFFQESEPWKIFTFAKRNNLRVFALSYHDDLLNFTSRYRERDSDLMCIEIPVESVLRLTGTPATELYEENPDLAPIWFAETNYKIMEYVFAIIDQKLLKQIPVGCFVGYAKVLRTMERVKKHAHETRVYSLLFAPQNLNQDARYIDTGFYDCLYNKNGKHWKEFVAELIDTGFIYMKDDLIYSYHEKRISKGSKANSVFVELAEQITENVSPMDIYRYAVNYIKKKSSDFDDLDED